MVAVISFFSLVGCELQKNSKSSSNIASCERHGGKLSHGGCLCVDKIFDSDKFKCRPKQSFSGTCTLKLAYYQPNGTCRKNYDSFDGIVPDSGDCDQGKCAPMQARRTISKTAAHKCFKAPKNIRTLSGRCLSFEAKLLPL